MWGSPSQQDVEGSCDKHALLALTVFRAPRKRISFFCAGRLRPELSPKPSRVTFSLLERADLGRRCQKEGIWGKTIAGVRVGWTGPKKGNRMRKKRWVQPLSLETRTTPHLGLARHLHACYQGPVDFSPTPTSEGMSS